VADPRIAFFDDLAQRWDDESPSSEQMVSRLIQHADLLALEPGEALLEVGCGTGKTTGYLVEQVAPGRVTAIDFAPKMIDKARAKYIDADFLCMDICSDDLGTARYDVVLCFHSFPHFRDQPAALRNLRRAMKDTGRLIIMHCAGSAHINRFHANLTGAVKHDLLPVGDEWDALLGGASMVRQTHIDHCDLLLLTAQVQPR
jgi:demethylmenaquinone methyltransferase/2-methoxy-6-polyprenyl-1,4-benzoquinol methylase